VAHPARHAAADGDRPVAFAHDAVADHDILTGSGHPPAVLVHARVDGDAVISGGKGAALDKDIAARVRVESIGVRSFGLDGDTSHQDVFAIDRVHRPHRAVEKGHTLNKHIAAAHRLQELRP